MRGREKPDVERSAAERAAAAAARAQRRGHAPPPTPPAPEPPEPVTEPTPEPRVQRRREPAPVEERVPEPRPVPRGTPIQRPAPKARAGAERPPTRPAPPLRGRASAEPRRPLPPSSPRGSYLGRRVLGVLALLVVAGVVWLGVQVFQPFHGDPSGVVRVKIPPGADAGSIGELLADRGVVDNGTFFSINATVTGRRGKLRDGTYTLHRDMTYGEVLDALGKGPKAVVLKTFKLTLPEGLSRREMAPVVKKGGVEGDYLKASSEPAVLRRAHRLGLPSGGRSTEGFLFPATYDLVRGAQAGDLLAKQLSAFADNFASLDLRRARRRGLNRYDVLIIASMVEREAQLDSERPLIAAVIYNRLKAGMPLGIDATIRYAENVWDRPLKQSELDRPGPYNTRLNRNLPPTPIGNPGLASLEAAARPAKVDHLYYVVKPGACGRHVFSDTDAQAARDRARYDAAREAAGGKSPTTC